jgi:acetyltransferase
MGDADVEAGAELLNQAGIPTFPYPDTAARLFNYMWRYSDNLRGIYETPTLSDRDDAEVSKRSWTTALLEQVRQSGRTLLTEVESKQVLAAYSIPTTTTYGATSADQAVQLAEAMGYPVVLKLLSETITHKTDVGGVHLNLATAAAVRQAYDDIAKAVTQCAGVEHFQGVTVQPMVKLNGYELILGSSLDEQFGPVMLFGTGGQLVEVFHDRALALPPLNTTLARRMMEKTQIYEALQGVRGRSAVDLSALEQVLVRFSHLVVEQPWIKEIDINPLVAAPIKSCSTTETTTLIALDARIVLHDPTICLEEIPKLAIRPYPTQYNSPWRLHDGTAVTIRPIRPEDEPLMIQFHKTLSEESVYFRYFHLIKLNHRIAHERLTRICFIDYDREMALVADYRDPHTGNHEILAVARLSKLHGTNNAEFALVVSDHYQCQGLGTEMLKRLLQIGKDEKLDRIGAEILSGNSGMQRVCEKLGFDIQNTIDLDVVQAMIEV